MRSPRHRPTTKVRAILRGVGLRHVRQQKDADGAYCLDCGATFNDETEPYWHWSKTVKAHKDGTGGIIGKKFAHHIVYARRM
jgi:hypothetical protein